MLYFIGFMINLSLTNTSDILKYKYRYAFIPFTFMLTGLCIIITYGNNIMNVFNPFFYLNYADVFGSMWCFMAVFLGIIGVLHI
jgi:hypothetical protein